MDAKGIVNVGVIGCGIICKNYLSHMVGIYPWMKVTACSDIIEDAARAMAAQFPGLRPMSNAELLADPSIDLVVNLTIPAAHFDLSMEALKMGKHVYSEKPLALTREQCEILCTEAKSRGLRVGCATDTFMGGGIQTLVKLVREGAIGKVISINGNMLYHGPESFHPHAEFYYVAGGGPLFDMGPYYLNTFIAMLGPVRRVCGMAMRGTSTRYFGNGPRIPKEQIGRPIEVHVDTHINSLLEFACGATGTLNTSWDVWGTNTPNIEIHGVDGSIVFTDPNSYTGLIKLRRATDEDWREIHPMHCTECGRGIGIADMADAILHDRPFRASGEMAIHVIDIMQSIMESAANGSAVTLRTSCPVPEPLPPWLPLGRLA